MMVSNFRDWKMCVKVHLKEKNSDNPFLNEHLIQPVYKVLPILPPSL